MKTYIGVRHTAPNRCVVYVEEPNGNGTTDRRVLEHRRNHRSHSPTGFAWGYGGSGPAELAHAIVKDITGDPNPHPAVYQQFKFDVIAGLPDAGWRLTETEVRAAVETADRMAKRG